MLKTREKVSKQETLSFRCNICGHKCKVKASLLSREEPSCSTCRSTVRMRSIVHVVSTELFGNGLALPDFPKRHDIRGIGMSDWEGYAVPLSKKLGYTNTFYDKEPKLDITSIDAAMQGTLDFLISSDVFEHVAPPVSRAFENARKLLKPNGVFIFTVPYSTDARTIEYFPDLYNYEILKRDNAYMLKNMTREGVEQRYDNLVFHGGGGFTLEMRLFSETSLIEEFARCGFNAVKIYQEPVPDFGIQWAYDMFPMAASWDQAQPAFPPLSAELRLLEVGPAKIEAGKDFYMQANGLSALWAKTENATKTMVIVWDKIQLKTTYGGHGSLTAFVPKELYAKPGKFLVYLLDTQTKKRSNIITVTVE